jgi:hypothetical protein
LAERERQVRLSSERERAEAAEREQMIAEEGRQRARAWLVVAVIIAMCSWIGAGLAYGLLRTGVFVIDPNPPGAGPDE